MIINLENFKMLQREIKELKKLVHFAYNEGYTDRDEKKIAPPGCYRFSSSFARLSVVNDYPKEFPLG